MVRGYVYSGRYVLKYLLDVTGGMIIREGTFIWQKIVHQVGGCIATENKIPLSFVFLVSAENVL